MIYCFIHFQSFERLRALPQILLEIKVLRIFLSYCEKVTNRLEYILCDILSRKAIGNIKQDQFDKKITFIKWNNPEDLFVSSTAVVFLSLPIKKFVVNIEASSKAFDVQDIYGHIKLFKSNLNTINSKKESAKKNGWGGAKCPPFCPSAVWIYDSVFKL